MEKHIPYEQLKHRACDFIVKYRFFSAEEGGRKTGPPAQGYRSDFLYAEDKVGKGAWIIHPEFLDENDNLILDRSICVSESGKALMWILNDEKQEFHKNRIKLGQKGFFMEGPFKTAECEVIKIVDLAKI